MPVDYLESELCDLLGGDADLLDALGAESLDGLIYSDLTRPGVEWLSRDAREVLGPEMARGGASDPPKVRPTDRRGHVEPRAAETPTSTPLRPGPDPIAERIRGLPRADGGTALILMREMMLVDSSGRAVRSLAGLCDLARPGRDATLLARACGSLLAPREAGAEAAPPEYLLLGAMDLAAGPLLRDIAQGAARVEVAEAGERPIRMARGIATGAGRLSEMLDAFAPPRPGRSTPPDGTMGRAEPLARTA